MLDISPILLLSSAIIFLIVLARLNLSLYKPLTKHMDDRSSSIAKDLEDARNNASDVDGMYAEASNVIAKARAEASSIREGASIEANTLGDAKIQEVKKEIEGKYNIFASDLQTDCQSLKVSLVEKMPLFKSALSAKLSSI